MQKAWTPPVRWILLVAAVLSLFSTAQAYRLATLNLKVDYDINIGALLLLNTAYWFVPAAFTLPIFYLGRRYRLDSQRWPRAMIVHIAAAALFSAVHLGCMILVRLTMWPDAGKPPTVSWGAFAQRQYLMQLDWLLMTYSAIIGLSYALDYRRESQARALKTANLETRLIEARLKTLQAELHPHFLFNTLHSISALVRSDPRAVEHALERLAALLRRLLDVNRGGADQIALAEEWEIVRDQLDLETLRFGDRLHIDEQIEPDALECLVPVFTVQPLVENAIRHAVATRTQTCVVRIRAAVHDEQLIIEVTDDGPGADPRAVHAAPGLGLSAVRQRLLALYGDRAGVRIDTAPGRGFSVRVTMPAIAKAVELASADSRTKAGVA